MDRRRLHPLGSRWRRAGCILGAVGLLGMGLLSAASSIAAAAGPNDSADDSVSYRIDPAHTSSQPNDQLAVPLHQRWAVDFRDGSPYWLTQGGRIWYPLIAGGRVFVSAATSTGTTLYALDAATGQRLWNDPLPASRPWSATAYDAGRVFAITMDGVLRAFDAATGAVSWTVKLSQYFFESPPTAVGGIVYLIGAGGGSTLFAVSEANGHVLWHQESVAIFGSAPTVSSDAVYITSWAGDDDAFDRLTGAPLWQHRVIAGGGLGYTAALYDDLLYDPDPHQVAGVADKSVLEATTGAVLEHFAADVAPSFDGLKVFLVSQGELRAELIGTGITLWTAALPVGVQIVSSPIADGRDVFVADFSGHVYAFDERTGAETWAASHPVDPLDCGTCWMTQIAVAEHELLVPVGHDLVAYS